VREQQQDYVMYEQYQDDRLVMMLLVILMHYHILQELVHIHQLQREHYRD
jgi:hypothetical protein